MALHAHGDAHTRAHKQQVNIRHEAMWVFMAPIILVAVTWFFIVPRFYSSTATNKRTLGDDDNMRSPRREVGGGGGFSVRTYLRAGLLVCLCVNQVRISMCVQ